MFVMYHINSENGLLYSINVVKNFTQMLIEKFGEKYEHRMLQRFSMARTMFRMRWLQQQMASEHAETLRSRIKCISYKY